MKLAFIQIENFRSIKSDRIVFFHNCLILLGKNEAGKTNVLKAIAAVFGLYKVSSKDKRKRIENEKIDKYHVTAEFALDSSDFARIEHVFLNKFKGIDFLEFKNGFSLRSYIEERFKKVLMYIEIKDGGKPFFTTYEMDEAKYDLEEILYLSGSNISKEGTIKFNLYNEVRNVVFSIYQEQEIRCHYWQYNDSYLLPGSVDIDEFVEDPEAHPALKNIFELCGRGNIEVEFANSKSEDGDYSNLFEQVSKRTTHTFQKIWKDFRGTSIQLMPNGSDVLIKVVEKAKYNFEDRSDGFKKFISILLMLSTKARSNKFFENDLILIDEPDQSLYPTSAQYLKEELIEISKKARVIFTTHSQYMIDADVLDRHIVVDKVNDITTLKKFDAYSPFSGDELLRRAIGSSIFECLKNTNLIFEGYLDRELFNKYCNEVKIAKDFSLYGSVFLNGISGVDTLVQIMILANKRFLVIADSDAQSKGKKKDFIKNFEEYSGSWIDYDEVLGSETTMEDFFKIDYICRVLQQYGINEEYDYSKTAMINIDRFVKGNKELKQDIKRSLVGNFKKNDIRSEYSAFINLMKSRLGV